jgi:hypothetical protein
VSVQLHPNPQQGGDAVARSVTYKYRSDSITTADLLRDRVFCKEVSKLIVAR